MKLKAPKRYSRQRIFHGEDFPVRMSVLSGKNAEPTGVSYHSELEFQMSCKGKFRYFVGDSNYICQENSVLVIHKNEIHNFLPDPESNIRKISLMFSPKMLIKRDGYSCAIKTLEDIHQITLSEKEAAMAEFLLINISEELKQKKDMWQQVIWDHLEAFIIILSRAKGNITASAENKDPVIQEVIQYIDTRFAEKISLSELSEHFNMSAYSLCRKFKRYAGIGFREYLINRRILEARKLLEGTDMKVLAVAYSVGFDNLSTFNRDFRMLIGMTPEKYRRISAAK